MPGADDAVWLDVLPSMEGFFPALKKGLGKGPEDEGKGFGRRFGKAALAGMAVVGTGAALATKALYNVGETFDEVADTIRVGTGATGKALDGLVGSAKNVATKVPASLEEIGAAIGDVNTRLGLTGEPLEKVASQFLELGRITGEKVDIGKTTKALSAFGIEGEDVSGALDHLYQVSQASGVSIGDLATQLGTNGAVVKELGLSFEEASVLVGTLDKAGLNGSQVMSGLSRSMVQLAKDGEKPKVAFERVTGEMEGLLKQGKESEAIDLAGKMFGTRGAPQLIAALKSGALSFEDLSKMAGQTEDTILGAGEDTADFAEQWMLFKNKVLVVVEPLATKLFTAIGDGMGWINTNAVPILQRFIEEFQSGEGAGGELRRTLEGVWEAVKGVFGWIRDNWDIIGGVAAILLGIAAAVKAWIAVQTVLNVVLSLNPIGLVVIAIAALIAGLVLLWNKNKGFRDFIIGVWDAIKGAVAVTFDWFTNTLVPGIQWVWEQIVNIFKSHVQFAKDIFTGFVDANRRIWQAIKDTFWAAIEWIKGIFNGFVEANKIIWQTIKDIFWAVITWVKTTFTNGWNGLKDILTWPARKAAELLPAVRKRITDAIWAAWTWARDTFSKGWNKLRDIITSPIDKARDAVGKALDKIKNAFSRVRDAIGDIWSGLKGKMAGPVKWVADNVVNPLIGGFNKVAGAVGITKLPKWSFSFADGGVLPGFTPGRDVHHFVSPTGGRLSLSGGEAVMRPEFTRAVGGRAGVDRLNAAARSGQAFAGGGVFQPVPGHANRHGTGYPWASFAGDFPVSMGTPIKAWKDGIVAAVRRLTYSYGKHVRVNHDDGTSSLYAHMSKILVSLGQRVLGGQTLGRVGSTGNSTGPHLHFETMGGRYRGGRSGGLADLFAGFTNPLSWLKDLISAPLQKLSGAPGGFWGDVIAGLPGKIKDGMLDKISPFDSGGFLQPGYTLAFNGTGRPEPVFTSDQFDSMRGGISAEDLRAALDGARLELDDSGNAFLRVSDVAHARRGALQTMRSGVTNG